MHEINSRYFFKGGTVLKKIYFEDYRFSEDLDFTLLDNAITNEQIFSWFKEVFEYVRDEANIPLEIIDNNEHEDGGINFYISYVGPLGGQGNNKKVKVDISRSEKLEFDPVLKPVFINYSDLVEHELLCYPLEEVLIEKLRSVIQWMQARENKNGNNGYTANVPALVEPRGVEPLSKHIRRKLSTCLFHY